MYLLQIDTAVSRGKLFCLKNILKICLECDQLLKFMRIEARITIEEN